MKEYRMYTPSAEGYCLFRKNLKSTNPDWLKKEEKFLEEFLDNPANTNEAIVAQRVKTLNAFYHTIIFAVEQSEITKIILQPGFDAELDSDGYESVEKIRHVPNTKKGKEYRDCLSFATKYCHHCRPDKYPIFDSVNVNVLTVCMGYQDSRNYTEYVECFKKFCSAIGCDELKDGEGFYIDKYIQAIGGHRELLFPLPE